MNHLLENITVGARLKELNREACVIRYWRAVRYTSSLLQQMVESISPYITQILVNGKQVGKHFFKYYILE